MKELTHEQEIEYMQEITAMFIVTTQIGKCSEIENIKNVGACFGLIFAGMGVASREPARGALAMGEFLKSVELAYGRANRRTAMMRKEVSKLENSEESSLQSDEKPV